MELGKVRVSCQTKNFHKYSKKNNWLVIFTLSLHRKTSKTISISENPMKKILTWVAVMSVLACHAQENALIDLTLQARGDYQRVYDDGEAVKDDCGFKGQYLNLIIKGEINEKFSYSYRQRLNKISKTSFFEATDWLHLDYKPIEDVVLSGGKQVVAIGGYEYDRAPIDLYYCSEFWNNVPCYEWGASASYSFNKGRDNLMFQFCESPFRSFYSNADMYAYNLQWTGNHGLWSTLWSVNLMEWRQGRFINYIALGNEFNFTPRLRLQLDVMNRASSHQTFLFKDCSVMAELAYRPVPKLNLFGKFTYDVNRSGTAADMLVHDGTELKSVGAGLEFFPIRGKMDVRLHANYSYAWGTNTNLYGVMQDRQSYVSVGATWSMNLLNWRKK